MDSTTEIEEIAAAIHDATLLKELIVASFSLLIYDFLMTFPAEVDFIWTSSWNVAKLLFFATRYLAIVDTSVGVLYILHPSFSPSICDKLYLTISIMYTIGLLVAEAILSLRTFAIWKGTRPIGVLLIIMNIALLISAVCLLSPTLRKNTFAQPVPPLSDIIPCDDTSPRHGTVVLLVLLTVQEFIIAVLTLWKALSHWRGGMGNPIRRVVLHDGILFFIVLLVMSTINMAFYSAPSLGNIYELLLTLQRVLHSIVTGRVILHLHVAAKEHRGLVTDGFHIYDPTKFTSNGSTTESGEVIVLGRLRISSNDV